VFVGAGGAQLQGADLLPDGLDPEERARAVLAAVRGQDRAALLQLRSPGSSGSAEEGAVPSVLNAAIVCVLVLLLVLLQVSGKDLKRFIHVLNTWETTRLFNKESIAQMRAAATRALQQADPSVRSAPEPAPPSPG